jgi:hypothetical protein
VTHRETQDRLEAYVDDRLSREERREVDRHLRDCEECRAILDDVAPVDLSGLGPATYDEATMRRTVRRSLFRTALDAALMLLAGLTLFWFLSALLIQPLVIDRGGRAADAVRMSIDLGAMLNPGAYLVEGQVSSNLLSRQVDLDFALPVGAGLTPTDHTSTTIGVFGVSDAGDAPGGPVFVGTEFMGEAADQLANLGSGTVSTVSMFYENPMSVEQAQDLADDPGADVRVMWAGFDSSLGQETPPNWTFTGALGYGTCLHQDPWDEEMLSASSAGFSRGSMFASPSVRRALDSVISGLENIESRPELVDYLVRPYGDDPESVSAVLDDLRNDPEVTMLVLTGPSPEVARFVDGSPGPAFAGVLAVDFYNWTDAICGGLDE